MSLYGPQDKYRFNKLLDDVRDKGFSLLETTIAIAIMVSAILGPMSLSSQSIRSASVARNTIIASNLAQEGLELVKNIQFNNKIQGKPWTQGLSSCSSVNGCFVDAKDLDINPCSVNCAFLKFDNSLRLYNYDVGPNTFFRRIITVSNITSDEIKVKTTVRWRDKFGAQFFNLETSMFNW